MSLERIINLIKKTGDKCVVVDQDGNPVYVIMGFNDYEHLMAGKVDLTGLTEEELLDKINRDVAIWRAAQEESKTKEFETLEEILEQSKGEEGEVEGEKYYFEPPVE